MERRAERARRDPRHAASTRPQTTFPTVVYRRYTKGWKRPLRLAYERRAGAGGIPGPLIRARVGDELRIHFKNLDTLRDQPHSMHFHGVEYEPSSDGIWLPLHSGKGGNVKPGQTFTYELTAGRGSAGVWPYHDHSASMEDSIAGGMFGALSIAGRARAARRPRVRRRVRALARLPDDQRARVRRQHAGVPSRASARRVQWDVIAMGDEFHTFHVHGHRWRTDGGTPEDTRGLGPAESFRVRWREDAPGTWLYHCHVETHMAQGMIGLYRVRPMSRAGDRARSRCAAALAAPAAAAADDVEITMPGKFFDPARSTTVAGDAITFRNNDLVTHDVRIARRPVRLRPDRALHAAGRRRSTQPGEYPFVCTLHAFMSGNLSVVAATLAAAPDGVLAGEPLTLSGRAPAGTAQRRRRALDAGGAWVAARRRRDARRRRHLLGEDARRSRARRTASRRRPARARAVTPRVTARVDLHVTLGGQRRALLHVHAMPAPAGMVATLELYARWHYRWRAHRTVKLDSDGARDVPAAARRAHLRARRAAPPRRAGRRSSQRRAAHVGRPHGARSGHDHAARRRAPRRRARGRRTAGTASVGSGLGAGERRRALPVHRPGVHGLVAVHVVAVGTVMRRSASTRSRPSSS